jgi:hypothetical protein
MPINWTVEQIIKISPDAASAKAGKELANIRKWSRLGFDGQFVWGYCQGSGKDPYKACTDISEPAFKCSCPSHKFPCKHSIALFLLLANQEEAFAKAEQPDWVKAWAEARVKQAEKKAKKEEKKATEEVKPIDTAKQAKRIAEREAKIIAGLEELDLWLKDLIRQGLASVQTANYSFWDRPAARMTDAQAPGLARMIREMAGISVSGEGWQELLLERLSRLHLLTTSYKNLDKLPPLVQEDIRTMIGWTQKQDELLKNTGVADKWTVLGLKVEDDPLTPGLKTQRVWLQGQESKQFALILNFAFAKQPLDNSLVQNTTFQAELVFFPSAYPLRAVIKSRQNIIDNKEVMFSASISQAFASCSEALAKNPWIERFPMALENVVPAFSKDSWRLCDDESNEIAISPSYKATWELLAFSGGHPIKIFGEWYQNKFFPLNFWAEN